MEELPGGRGSRCVASRRRIEAPAAIHVLAYHPTSSMPSCRIDGMRSSKGADRPASRSLAGPLAPSWRSHSNIFTPTQQLSLRRVGRRLRRRTQYWCMQMCPLASRSSILFQQPRFGTMPRCGSYWDGHASPETWSASAIVCRISNTRSRQVLWSSRCNEGLHG